MMIQKLSKEEFPPFIIWEITNKCNSKCIHCYNNSASKRPLELDRSQITRICDEILENKVVRVDILGGEPQISPYFELITNKLRKNVALGLITNGIFKGDLALLKNYSQVQISVDGLLENYARIRGIDCFDKIEKRIEQYVTHLGNKLVVAITINKLNINELKSIIDFCVSKGVKKFKISEFISTGRAKSNEKILKPSAQDYSSARKIIQSYSEPISIEWEASSINNKNILLLPQKEGWIGLSSEGDICPNPFLPFAIGNIRNISIKTAWKKAKLAPRVYFNKILSKFGQNLLDFNNFVEYDLDKKSTKIRSIH